MAKKTPKTILKKVVSERTVAKNAAAFRVYDTYKKAADVIDRAELASGKRLTFRSDAGSTLNFEVNRNGAYSTTAQNI